MGKRRGHGRHLTGEKHQAVERKRWSTVFAVNAVKRDRAPAELPLHALNFHSLARPEKRDARQLGKDLGDHGGDRAHESQGHAF